jgi:hypothetical protein
VSERNDVKNWRIEDTFGLHKNHVLSSKWSNSPTQRDLMMDYSLEHLVVEVPSSGSPQEPKII